VSCLSGVLVIDSGVAGSGGCCTSGVQLVSLSEHREGGEANTVVAHEVTKVQEALQVGLWFVVILTIPLMTAEPVQEGVGERYMSAASEVVFMESMSRIQVCLEERLEVKWLCSSWVCGIDEEAVLEVASSKGAYLGNRLLLSVVALFCQWGRKWGMMSLCLPTEGFLYSEICSIFGVLFPMMTDLEGFALLLTDEVLGMTDYEGFVLAERFLLLLAEQDLSIFFLLSCACKP
jgi:hypothetical protein